MDLQAVERRRIEALISADMETAEPLHAEDFEFISVPGSVLGKAAYLGAVKSGVIRYVVWEPGPITVRAWKGAGVLRYRAQLANVIGGVASPLQHVWQTHLYEERDRRWQVVWSQATLTETPQAR